MNTQSPFVMIIYGVTGDLTRTKLMPALYELYRSGLVSRNMFIVGVSRRELTNDEFRELMREAVQAADPDRFDLNTWGEMADGLYYESGYFENPELYDKVVARLSRFDDTMRACVPRFFYLATPPEHYETILTHLEKSGLSEGCGHGTINFTRLLIEKPFGKDLTTAQELEKLLCRYFEEKQIYRIDHYLGKETVQNLLAFRFANGIFEPTWNREFIDHVQITLAETDGVTGRGSFYDGVGALRDVVQNHMLEMLALVAMEQPASFDADSIRKARVNALQSVACINPTDVAGSVVRGQYVTDGKHIGYLQEKGVRAGSDTETFVALKLSVGNDRWRGVPFYLRTGKRLSRKITEISLHYKKPLLCTGDVCLFAPDQVYRNVLNIRIEPDEGIDLRLMVKKPGFGMSLAPTRMDFSYASAFRTGKGPGAYSRLLLDALRGDQTLFAHASGIDASWQVMTKIREGWQAVNPPLYGYQPGTWGPKEADAIIERDQRHWFMHI